MKKKYVFTFLAVLFLACFAVTASVVAQETPKPGTVIDKSNYKKYAHLFPPEFLQAFEDGWGVVKPFSIKVGPTTSKPVSKAYLAYSAKNKGKVGLDAQGYLTNYNFEGLPFPDLQKTDKDYATKLMWNYDMKYIYDDQHQVLSLGWEQRKGEKLKCVTWEFIIMYFRDRMVLSPKPNLDNPINLYKAQLMHIIEPVSSKNTMTVTYRYADAKKADDTFIYLPVLRRTLRGEAGQRSTPILGSTNAVDDFGGFDGKVSEFTYKVIGEKKVLGVANNKYGTKAASPTKNWKDTSMPYAADNWEVRDVYVIEILAKDPKYPQSKKVIYLDKESGVDVYYAIAYDRAGKLWKIWNIDWQRYPMPGGEFGSSQSGMWGIDIQFGMASFYCTDQVINAGNYTYADVASNNLIKRAR